MCLDAAEADPSQLDRVAATPAAATILTGEGAEAAAAMKDVNHGLVNFRLVPMAGASCQLFAKIDTCAAVYWHLPGFSRATALQGFRRQLSVLR